MLTKISSLTFTYNMKLRQNLHIHSSHSCDSACATIQDIQKEMLDYGMVEFGLTDHIHSQFNLCDIASSRNDFDVYAQSPCFHFGVEATCMAKWECDKIAAGDYKRQGDDPVYGLRYVELPLETPELTLGITEEDIQKYHIEYVIGGTHWPSIGTDAPDKIYEDNFQQMLFLIRHPLVDILAHPWYDIDYAIGGMHVHKAGSQPAREAFLHVPERMNDQLCAELIKYGKCAEINISMFQDNRSPEEVHRKYWRMLEDWRDAGVRFTFGNDLHAAHSCKNCLALMEQLLEAHGFHEEHFKLLFA